MSRSDFDPFSPAVDMLRALRRDTITARGLYDLHRERIERYNPILNAIVARDDARATAEADAADCERQRGAERALLGLPLTIKDAIDVAGLPTTAGLTRRRDSYPGSDAPLVARLRAAGGVVLGKTNVPRYLGDWQTDNPVYGRTVNPWDTGRTPGGSTGGGAAAVAAGLSPLEFGSDLGGSIRIPAAFCGIYGHRPSDGIVPAGGQFPGSPLPNPAVALQVAGPLARSAADLELALDVIAGPDTGDDAGWTLRLPPPRHSRLADFRVAVLPTAGWCPVAAEIVEALGTLAERLRNVGCQVEVASPDGFGDLWTHHILYAAFVGAVFGFTAGLDEERRSREAEALLATGDAFDTARAEGLTATAAQFLEYQAQRERYRAAYRQFFSQWDVLLAPVTSVVAFPHDDRPLAERTLVVDGKSLPYMRLMVYPGVATLSGQPATAFPVGQTATGLPIGLQVIGPSLEDRTAIHFAHLVTQEWGGYTCPPGFE